jgi:SAM-dependent methyltransferase
MSAESPALRAGAGGWSPTATPVLFYLSVGLIAGAIIALQIAVMRIFSIASWAHFGSLVISIAMLGFGIASAVMCVGKARIEANQDLLAKICLLAFGPLLAAANGLAQMVPFNPIFLVSDPQQKLRLLANFLLYFSPFLPGAVFLGLAFLRGQKAFGRVYFSDLLGSGLGGLAFLGALYLLPPERLLLVPLGLWFVSGLAWFRMQRDVGGLILLLLAGALGILLNFALPQIESSPYKGVSYARHFPDAERIYEAASPFGDLEIYHSSYFHFAPGLSDMAAINLPSMPTDAYLGMFIDGDGPIGIIKALPDDQTAYFRFLPMYLPYVVKHDPAVFIVQFGGGISTSLALRSGASSVTVAEANPLVLQAMRDPKISALTGHMLENPRIHLVPFAGRLYAPQVHDSFDIVDLSLADSTGLSNAGGNTIFENYGYTREAMASYMRALKPGGILAVTIWNKEDPPKSAIRLFTTMTEAARLVDQGPIADRFYIAHTYLGTLTVLYQRGAFSAAEIAALDAHDKAMAFDVVYAPGRAYVGKTPADLYSRYRDNFFATSNSSPGSNPGGAAAGSAAPATAGGDATAPAAGSSAGGSENLGAELLAGQNSANGGDPNGDQTSTDGSDPNDNAATNDDFTMGALYKMIAAQLVSGHEPEVLRNYLFDGRPLTNDNPYFAGYVKLADLPAVFGMLDAVSDEWGYLLLWGTLAESLLLGLVLLLIPVVFGWRSIFSRQPGKLGILIYFLCLGLGYIVIEVGLIGKFVLALANPTVSASVLITGMLVFSGLGSLASGRYLDRCRVIMPRIFLAIAAILIAYSFILGPVLDVIGLWPYGLRIVACLALLLPPAFLMGFPFPTGMGMLSRLGKEHFFLWAWGINGLFSVIGSVAVPLIAVLFGLKALIWVAAIAYLVALPAFFALLLPVAAGSQRGLARG